MRRRTVDIHIMLNQEEGKKFDELCNKTNLTRVTLIRKMILNCPIKEKPYAEFLKVHDAINQIGNNFNQLVRRANALGTVSNSDMKEAQRVYKQVYRLMREWEKTWWRVNYQIERRVSAVNASPQSFFVENPNYLCWIY